MLKRRNVLAILVLSGYLISCTLFLPLSFPATSAQAHTVHYCQCVEYVNSHYNMHIPGDAYQWIANLPDHGWHQELVGTIRIGDIAVWDRSTMPNFGHVAIVSDITYFGPWIVITFLGANQYGFTPLQYVSRQCDNVNYWSDFSEWNSAVFFHR